MIKAAHTIQVSQKVTEYSFQDVAKDAQIKWISVDPEFKVLKEIKSLKITEENDNFKLAQMLTEQLRNAKTVCERIQAARILRDKKYLEHNVIDVLQKAILEDRLLWYICRSSEYPRILL